MGGVCRKHYGANGSPTWKCLVGGWTGGFGAQERGICW